MESEIDLALLESACPEEKGLFEDVDSLANPMCVSFPDHHFCALRKFINLSELEDKSFLSLHERELPWKTRTDFRTHRKSRYFMSPSKRMAIKKQPTQSKQKVESFGTQYNRKDPEKSPGLAVYS